MEGGGGRRREEGERVGEERALLCPELADVQSSALLHRQGFVQSNYPSGFLAPGLGCSAALPCTPRPSPGSGAAQAGAC